MRTTLPAALLLFFCANAMAQESQTLPLPRTALPSAIRFDHLDEFPRMAKRSVYAQLQDQRGFMWFGTSEGLVRFDGYDEVVFRHDDADSMSISSGSVSSLMEDRDGMLWVGTNSGLNRFDPATGRFTRFVHDEDDPTSLSDNQVQAIIEDEAHSVWVATMDGLNRFEPTSQGFSHYFDSVEERRTFGPDDVNALAAAPSNRLWVGTGTGLYRFDPASGTSESIWGGDAYADDAPRGAYIVSALHVDRRGTLWAGAPAGGLFTLSPPDSVLTLVDSVVRYLSYIHAITEDQDGTVWIGSQESLIRYDGATGSFAHFQHQDDDQTSLSHNHVRSIVADRQGSMWVGTLAGLNRFDPRLEGITMHVREGDDLAEVASSGTVSIVEDDDRGLWFATRTGLYRRDPISLRIEKVPLDGDYDARGSSPTTLLDRSGTLWLGWRKLHRWDQRSGRMVRVDPDPRSEYSSAAGFVTSLFEDKSGKVWVAYYSPGGFARYDPVSGQLVGYPLNGEDGMRAACIAWGLKFADGVNGAVWLSSRHGELGRFDPDSETYTRLNNARVTSPGRCSAAVGNLFQDSKGLMWRLPAVDATYEGIKSLSRFDPTTSTSIEYHSDSTGWQGLPRATAIFEDSRGTLWVATEKGLSVLDRSSGAFSLVDDPENILTNLWGAVFAEDLDGALWLAGSRGEIARLDPGSGEIRLFGPDEGLVSNDPFTTGFAASTGEVFFAGFSEIVSFFPDRMSGQDSPPQVSLTGLRLLNKSVEPGPNSPLERAMAFTDEIRLDHDQNNVTFEYVGLHYANPSKNQYAVWLEDYEETWRDNGTNRSAFYANLPPGSYVFRVKAASSNGTWSEEEASVRVVIRPPWWGSPWAYAFYVLLFAAGVFGVDRTQRRRIAARERMKAQERELEQARELEEAFKKLDAAHSKLKEAQDQLVHSEKMASLGQLTAGIAHEIKNPLNFVKNFAELNTELVEELIEELAEMDVPDDLQALVKDILDNARHIVKHGVRADTIVASMMDHAVAGSGVKETIDINTNIQEFANLSYHAWQSQHDEAQIRFEYDLAETLLPVEVVSQEMGRVWLNVFNNAYYAVEEKARSSGADYIPTVSVSSRNVDSGIEIRIADNGPGIPKDDQKNIFDPFYTTKPTGFGNTGLGLSLTHDIVSKGHGGAISVSEADNGGAVFTVVLPG